MHTQRSRTTPAMLTAQEEIRLVAAWTKNQDADAIATLCARFEPFIQARVAKLAKGVGPDARQDIVQDARAAFIKATHGYDATTGFRLSTYARAWVDAAVRDGVHEARGCKHLATSATSKRILYNHARATQKAKRQLAGTPLEGNGVALNRATARLLCVDEAALERHMNALRVVHLNAPLRDVNGDEGTVADHVPCPLDLNPERLVAESLDRDRAAASIIQALGKLAPRSAEIVRHRVLADTPQTLDTLAKRFGVSRERIRQIEEKALASLQADLAPIRHVLHA
jgi:RNA polymerase sigma-32 factor